MQDLVGKTFGRFTVISRSHRTEDKHPQWLWVCACECGERRLVRGPMLVSGRSKSCGCWKKKVLADLRRTHGMRDSLEYNSWVSMRSRCQNPKNNRFHRYGARGIRVHPEWNDSFESFLNAIGPSPGKGYSIDRIDPNGNYEPGNVRWATAKEQAANRPDYSNKLREAWVRRRAQQ